MATFLINDIEAGVLAGTKYLTDADRLVLYYTDKAQVPRDDADNINASGCTVEVHKIKESDKAACVAAEFGLSVQQGAPVAVVGTTKDVRYEAVANYIKEQTGVDIVQAPALFQAMTALSGEAEEHRKKAILSALETVDINNLGKSQSQSCQSGKKSNERAKKSEKKEKVSEKPELLADKISKIINKGMSQEFVQLDGIVDEILDYLDFVCDKSLRGKYAEATHRFGWTDGKDLYNLLKNNGLFDM